MQGQALKSGKSAFVDEHWNAYPNQWDKLFQTKKLEREEVEGYIKIPRGMLEDVINECKNARIPYDIEEQREKERPIRVSFNGELRIQQELAAQRLLAYDHGILSAATAFGKTVVCSHLIAERKVNTLILLESTDLITQWEEELEKFLSIDEEAPEYQTKTGRVKKRTSNIDNIIWSLYGKEYGR